MKTIRSLLVLLGWGMTVAAAFVPNAAADGAASPAPLASTSASVSASVSAPVSVSVATSASSAPAPVQTVTIGIAQVIRGGGNAPKSLSNALLAVQPALDACYAEAIDKEGDASANVSLRLEIDPPGRIVSSTIASSEDASATLRGCTRDAFAGLAAGPVGKQPMEILVPIAYARDASSDALRPRSACPAAWEDDGSGGELPDALRGELKERATRAGYCFKRPPAAGEPATLKKGTMEVHLRIAADGSVCGASAVGDPFERPSLTSCVLETMGAKLDGEPIGAIEVVVPLAFQGT